MSLLTRCLQRVQPPVGTTAISHSSNRCTLSPDLLRVLSRFRTIVPFSGIAHDPMRFVRTKEIDVEEADPAAVTVVGNAGVDFPHTRTYSALSQPLR